MTGTSATNLRETYFTYKTLTPIAGEPDLESINKLKKQLLANAENVPNAIHQAHGYLGLVMTPAEYSIISQTAFDRPGPVAEVDTNGTAAEVAARERRHARETAYLKEYTQMDRILLQQIREAIDEDYITAKVSPTTGNIRGTIQDLLSYLQDTYAYISEEELEVRRAEVTAMNYQAGQPVDTIFLKIETFAELAHLAKADLTEAQKIAMGKVIILKTGAYELYLAEWDRKPRTDKTWPQFKSFFRNAHKEQRQSRPTLREITPQMNQMGIEDIIQQLQEGMRMEEPATSEVLKMYQTTMQSNAAMMAAMMKQMKEMQQAGKTNSNNNRQKKYCWTHGLQHSHSGGECNNKKEGHKDEATAKNHMGGSTRGLGKKTDS